MILEGTSKEQLEEYYPQLKEANILYGYVSEPDYEENLYILFEQDGKLFEQYDSHCSCYGFESWQPEILNTLEEGLVKPNEYFRGGSSLVNKLIEDWFVSSSKKEVIH